MAHFVQKQLTRANNLGTLEDGEDGQTSSSKNSDSVGGSSTNESVTLLLLLYVTLVMTQTSIFVNLRQFTVKTFTPLLISPFVSYQTKSNYI